MIQNNQSGNAEILSRPFDPAELDHELPPLDNVTCHIIGDTARSVQPLSAWQGLIDNVVAYNQRASPTHDRQQTLTLRGGEPLMSDLLVPLAAHATQSGIKRVAVRSALQRSGTSQTRFDALLDTLRPDADELAVPINTLPPEAETAGAEPDSLELSISGLMQAQAARRQVVAETEITPTNNRDGPQMVGALRERGVVLGQSATDAQQPSGMQRWDYRGHSNPTTHGTFYSAAQANAAYGVRATLELYDNTGPQRMHVDPLGAAYTHVYDANGATREVVFGDIMRDFTGTMHRYHESNKLKMLASNVPVRQISRQRAISRLDRSGSRGPAWNGLAPAFGPDHTVWHDLPWQR